MKQQKMVAVDLTRWWNEKTVNLDTITGKPRHENDDDYEDDDDYIMLQELPLRKYLDSGWTVDSYKVAGNGGTLIVLLEKDKA